MRYRRVIISRFGGPEVLEVIEDNLRDPQPGEVRVKVLAAGVSWVESMMRHGLYPRQPKPPFTPVTSDRVSRFTLALSWP